MRKMFEAIGKVTTRLMAVDEYLDKLEDMK